MPQRLEPLLADGVIDEVVARLRGGKEADVWLVRHAGELVTAKVYKDRHLRSFKNDAAYKEGRQVRNTRTQRAMDRGSRFGQAAAQDAWKTKEADALYRLHAAGLRVPRPVLFYEGVLLMELVVDAHGRPAPRLVDAPLGQGQAAQLYAELRKQVVGMLACDLVHGDLSPYNVLASWNGPVVIDFPQVIEAAHNSQAEKFLLRDVQNVQRFCAALDPALRAAEGDGREIWRAYVRRELTADFVPSGRGGAERHVHEPASRGSPGGPWRGPRREPTLPGAARPGPSPAGAPGSRRGGERPGGAGFDPRSRHGGGHPHGGEQHGAGPGAVPRRPAPGPRRAPMPEVIRVVRGELPKPAAPVQVAGTAGGRRRRRRHR